MMQFKKVHRRNKAFFKSDAIAKILGIDHTDMKAHIRSNGFSTADFWAENYNMTDDGIILMTESGLWNYLWAIGTGVIPAETMERLFIYIKNVNQVHYVERVLQINRRLSKAVVMLLDAMHQINDIERPVIEQENDPLPGLLNTLGRISTGCLFQDGERGENP